MKKALGILLIITGVICIPRIISPSAPEIIGGLIGVSLFSFLPAYFLLRSKKTKNNSDENIDIYDISKRGADYISTHFKPLSSKGFGEAILFCSSFLIDSNSKEKYNQDIETITSNFALTYLDNFNGNDEDVRKFIDSRIFFYWDEYRKLKQSSYYTPMAIYNAFYINPFVNDPDNIKEFNESPMELFAFQAVLNNTVSLINELKNR